MSLPSDVPEEWREDYPAWYEFVEIVHAASPEKADTFGFEIRRDEGLAYCLAARAAVELGLVIPLDLIERFVIEENGSDMPLNSTLRYLDELRERVRPQ